MFRIVITLGNLKYISKNFNTKSEGENWVLEIAEKQKIKRADLLDKKTNIRKQIF